MNIRVFVTVRHKAPVENKIPFIQYEYKFCRFLRLINIVKDISKRVCLINPGLGIFAD